MAEIIVTDRLALRPISEVVGFHHPERAAHADAGAYPYQCAFEPQRTLETVVNQAAVKADAVAEQKRPGTPTEGRKRFVPFFLSVWSDAMCA